MIDVTLTFFKNAIGDMVGEFEFGLFDQDNLLQSDTNDSDGLVRITERFTQEGEYAYNLREIDAPEGWLVDTTIFPVLISVTEDEEGEFFAQVEYPDGMPGFRNTKEDEPCSLVVFEEICFDEPGVYEFTLRETSDSGDGWDIDDSVYRVIVTVIDDGHGNLVASFEYPDGFPEFTNTYVLEPVCVVISARKRAIGAELPCGRFQFGLFDEDGQLVATARNE